VTWHETFDAQQPPPKRRGETGCVYLIEDGDGEIIYVGMTSGWRWRRAVHAALTTWWAEAVTVHVLYAPSPAYLYGTEVIRRQLEDSERFLIQMLDPKYNVRMRRRAASA
jgi:excinuclease UvrABC nuclease subunit